MPEAHLYTEWRDGLQPIALHDLPCQISLSLKHIHAGYVRCARPVKRLPLYGWQ